MKVITVASEIHQVLGQQGNVVVLQPVVHGFRQPTHGRFIVALHNFHPATNYLRDAHYPKWYISHAGQSGVYDRRADVLYRPHMLRYVEFLGFNTQDIPDIMWAYDMYTTVR